MELLIAGLVNATADVLWLVAFATGFTFTGRMTPAEFHARMSARV